MRTIRFRGKDIRTGEWRYGYYAVQHIGNFDPHGNRSDGYTVRHAIFNDEDGKRSNGGYWKEVDENTVGQDTSLRDKFGKPIYEGDILAVNYADEKSYLEVRFVRGVFAFLWNGDLDDEFPCNAPTQEWAEVIGNIHDNPKLIIR